MDIRAVIVDDESNGRDTLAMMLQQYCPIVKIVGSASAFETGLQVVRDTKPDLLFLDIEMPMGSGFDLLDAIAQPTLYTIFTTAYTQYAWRAFRVQAVDYLLKPIMPEHLVDAVQRVAERFTLPDNEEYSAAGTLEDLLSVLVDRSAHSSRIPLRTSTSIEFVQVRDIIRCEAENSYTIFFLSDGERLLISRTLSEFEAMLSEFHFLRVHNSHLINVAHIRRYVKGDGGYLIMSDGSKVMLPRRRKEELIHTITAALSGRI